MPFHLHYKVASFPRWREPNSHSIGINYRCLKNRCPELGSRLRGNNAEFWVIKAIGEAIEGITHLSP